MIRDALANGVASSVSYDAAIFGIKAHIAGYTTIKEKL